MGLTDRLRTFFAPVPVEEREYLNFAGNAYPIPFLNQTLTGTKEEIGSDFTGLGNGALKSNPVVFACMQARSSLFSEARFMYRRVRSGTPGELFSQPALELLRHPWPGGTTGDLLARTMQDADLAGNAFWVRKPGRLVRLRPDWVTFLHGSYADPQMDMWDPDAELLGYAYQPGGPGRGDPVFYQATEVAHFAPMPDPIAPVRGMSWLTSLVREVQADSQMTTHKQAFLVNGATVNLVITGVPGATLETYQKWVSEFEKNHKGAQNAYRSFYATAGMDAKALGSDMQQIDFKAVQGLGETRIAAAAGVPAAVVGISEGLAGSSLNAGNFQAAMRRFADLTMRPAWRNVCGSFERIIPVPGDAELWYDDRDIPALKDDIRDYAEVQSLQAQAVRQYVDAGFEPASVVDAVNSGDLKRLAHTGLYSVQLQPPMPEATEPDVTVTAPEPKQLTDGEDTGRSMAFEALTIARAAVDRPQPDAPVNHFHLTLPEARNEITVSPAAVNVSVEPTPIEIHNDVSVEPTPLEVRNEITVEPTPVAITNDVSVEPTPVEIRNEVTVEPTPLTVTVEPTPVTVTNVLPEPRSTTKRVVREGGQITQIIEEPTDG